MKAGLASCFSSRNSSNCLPGAPYSFMDPLAITRNRDLNTIKRLREAEVMHGRVAMVSVHDMYTFDHQALII